MTSKRTKRRRPQASGPKSSGRSRLVIVMGGVAALGSRRRLLGTRVLQAPELAGASQLAGRPLTVATLRVDVLREVPHDTTAFTQGLLWRDGALYESTGQYGSSRLRRIDPRTGVVEREVFIAPTLFGEGLALVGNELFMLTYQAERAMVFDTDTFEQVRSFRYRGEAGVCATTVNV